MEHGHIITERQLARLAKQAREFAGISQTEAARRLGVAQPTIAQAENAPGRKLTELRRRMISEFGLGYETAGPYYIIKHTGLPLDEINLHF